MFGERPSWQCFSIIQWWSIPFFMPMIETINWQIKWNKAFFYRFFLLFFYFYFFMKWRLGVEKQELEDSFFLWEIWILQQVDWVWLEAFSFPFWILYNFLFFKKWLWLQKKEKRKEKREKRKRKREKEKEKKTLLSFFWANWLTWDKSMDLFRTLFTISKFVKRRKEKKERKIKKEKEWKENQVKNWE